VKLHPRTRFAEAEGATLRLQLLCALNPYMDKLTTAELGRVVVQVLDDLLRGELRRERHPRHRDDTKADEACDRMRCPGYAAP
jgi:hypothetical protein